MSIHPRYWPTWLSASCACSSRCRFPAGLARPRRVGGLLVRCRSGRAHRASNLERACRSSQSRSEKILREHFRSLGVGIFETAISWWSSDARIRKLTRLKARAPAALTRRGAILLSAHFTTLEKSAHAR